MKQESVKGKVKFPCKCRSSHRFARARRPNKENLPARPQPVRLQLFTPALLAQNPLKPDPDLFTQNHVTEPCFRIGHREQSSQVAARPRNWNWTRRLVAVRLSLIYHAADLFGYPPMTLPCSMCSDLHRDGDKAIVIIAQVALDERLDLLCCGQFFNPGFPVSDWPPTAPTKEILPCCFQRPGPQTYHRVSYHPQSPAPYVRPSRSIFWSTRETVFSSSSLLTSPAGGRSSGVMGPKPSRMVRIRVAASLGGVVRRG